MYFVAHDIMTRTTSESWFEDEISQLWSESDNLEEIDTLMGCSRGLMTLINKISVHASTKAKVVPKCPATSNLVPDRETTLDIEKPSFDLH
ncbi:hypothetical protein N7474_010442 [Penicillium riverlandense]|uniref:uncharacterized protein n=1 Tax=Penicillium riverlandense TaxID=1903569 RepID=UPI002547C2DF|nr:uncharacterized protein N7474_010442 [Penicillium riverlandense]KAJ5806850.1 hypothetical protein N7474_010442 [Penicillium riverlandense]